MIANNSYSKSIHVQHTGSLLQSSEVQLIRVHLGYWNRFAGAAIQHDMRYKVSTGLYTHCQVKRQIIRGIQVR